jgi:WD40 repeat protein
MPRIIYILTLIVICILAAISDVTAADSLDYENLKSLGGYQGEVFSATFSPNGRYLAVGFNEGIVRIWEVQSWKIIATLNENENDVTAVAFSPDGKTLATADSQKRIILWDTDTWAKKTRLKAYGGVNALAYNKDGSRLAVASSDDVVQIWDIGSNDFKKLKGHNRKVNALAFSPDSARLVTGSNDDSIILWDSREGKKLNQAKVHNGSVTKVAFSNDGKLILSGSSDNTIAMHDAQKAEFMDILTGHNEEICSFTNLNGSNNIVISADCVNVPGPFGIMLRDTKSTCKIIFWDLIAKKPLKSLESNCDLAFVTVSPDDKYLVAGYVKSEKRIQVLQRK